MYRHASVDHSVRIGYNSIICILLNAFPRRQQMPLPAKNKTKTLILKGGGVKGLAFAGAIQELEDHGYKFKNFVGTSAGSIAAALLAAGASASELEETLAGTDFSTFCDSKFPRSIASFLLNGGLHSGDNLMNWVTSQLHERISTADGQNKISLKDVEDATNNSVKVFASQPGHGTMIFDSSDELTQDTNAAFAVRLSSSIPGFFVPKEYEGIRIYDGGILNNFPVDAYLKSTQSDPDFVALYIGVKRDPSIQKRWWLLEVLDLLLSRDERLNISEHSDRTVVIDTTPISTTDFSLSQEEKDLLILAGKTAAREFLDGQVSEENAELLEEKRLKVIRSRRLKRRSKRLFGAGLLVSTAVCIMWILYSSFFQASTELIEPGIPLFEKTYIGSIGRDRVSRPLTRRAIDDMSSTKARYNTNFEDQMVKFDAATQVVFFDDEGTAIKLLLCDSKYDGGVLVATASQPDGTVSPGVKVFVKEESDIEEVKIPFVAEVNPKSAWKHTASKELIGDYLSNGDRLKFLVVAKYENVFEDITQFNKRQAHYETKHTFDQSPWRLVSHRSLQEEHGTCSYLFLARKRGQVTISPHIFRQKHDSLTLLEIADPNPSLSSKIAWNRCAELIDFCSQKTVLDSYSEDLREAIQKVINAVKGGSNGHRDFAFTFDRANTGKLDSVENMNLLVFAERDYALSANTDEGASE